MPLNRLASRFISRAASAAFSFMLFAVIIFFRAVSRLFGSLRRLLSLVDYFYATVFFVLFSGIFDVICALAIFACK